MLESLVSASNILEELGIFWLLPVQQIFQIVNEGSLPQDAPLGQNYKGTNRKLLSASKVFDFTTGEMTLYAFTHS